ncbi:thioredoxin-related transmembrane protein 1-like protein [Dinothrombium tinctorium]|uniref:Thioredoxin-related transmembrane protein 1-like protein n=1 Tax=Dinothrombium tinctorium TaxID=1965070 RepID=A0A3S4QY37_9ACAR|nr:thioredoxin-related transmembrane protein 1-like protein [Dinothrombium tinctorium]RWS09146.1 thioredoxin-related transmembrane protein 1-like protein [Dinothrombium tinctorium]
MDDRVVSNSTHIILTFHLFRSQLIRVSFDHSYAPWCPACKSLKPQWDQFSSWSDDLGIKIASIDVTANPGLSGRFMVTALPTIYHVKEGTFRQYRGARDTESFVSFVEEKKWEKVDPIPKWKSPNSLQMSIVSYFFKISMALRTVHNRLVEDYGVPYWGSYVLFAFATILLGALLGLLIVCFIDLVFPAKTADLVVDLDSRKSSIVDKDKDDTSGDIIEDETENEQSEVRRRKHESNEQQESKENKMTNESKKET